MASVFSRWYVTMLKTRPMTTNVGSALLVMAAGDVLAQELEKKHVGETNIDIPVEKRLSLKRYGTVNPEAAQAAAERAFDDKVNQDDEEKPSEESRDKDGHETTNMEDRIMETISYAVVAVKAELEFLDGWRTSTMMGWSAFIYTPLYVSLYRVCDRYMPHQTPTTVCARVLLSFVLSIPINTAFFTYGTFVHHSMEWMAIQQEWKHELVENRGISHDAVESYGSVVPYDWEMLQLTARLKLESELVKTVLDSAKVWIPVNFLNFTVTPPHLRPMVLLVFSAFWNAYLSLAQHRTLDLSQLPEEGG